MAVKRKPATHADPIEQLARGDRTLGGRVDETLPDLEWRAAIDHVFAAWAAPRINGTRGRFRHHPRQQRAHLRTAAIPSFVAALMARGRTRAKAIQAAAERFGVTPDRVRGVLRESAKRE